MIQGGKVLEWKSIWQPKMLQPLLQDGDPGQQMLALHKTRTAKESRSGGVMKEEIFVLMEFCYLQDLVTLMLGTW